MRFTTRLFVFLSALVLISLFNLNVSVLSVEASNARNQPLSSGCAWLNLDSFDGFYGASSPYRGSGLTINAGERVLISANAPTNLDNPTQIWLIDRRTGATLAQTTFPGTLEYSFTQTGVLDVRWGVDVGNATIQVSCDRPHVSELRSHGRRAALIRSLLGR